MPEPQRFLSLPDDDHLRVVHWFGRISPLATEHTTARFTAWLKRIDERGRFIDDLVDEVTESIGAITSFPIGTHFRGQRRVRVGASPPPTDLSLRVPAAWDIRQASDIREGVRGNLIFPSDLALRMKRRGGGSVHGYEAKLVVAATDGGTRVLIPCSEIYRAFYAGSSDLAHSHLLRPWSKAREKFLENATETRDSDGCRHWHVDLLPNVPTSIAPNLCWLEFVEGAARSADETHASIVRQNVQKHELWLHAVPPISAGRLRLRAQTRYLKDSKVVLVTKIHDFQADIRVANITCTVPERVVQSGLTTDAPGDQVEKPRHTPAAIDRPGDRRKSKTFFDLRGDPIVWRGLPSPVVLPRRMRHVGASNPTQQSDTEADVIVSVGEQSARKGTRAAAQFTPTDPERLRNRFAEVIDALDQLVASGEVDDWDYLPICRPTQGKYCEFPALGGGVDGGRAARWCWPEGNLRVALVLGLQVKERTIYWIEIEPLPRGFKGLAVETLDGQPIDELVVATLLEACAFSQGIWNESLEYAPRPLLLSAERHGQLKGGQLSPNMFVRALDRLAAKRTKVASDGMEESRSEVYGL